MLICIDIFKSAKGRFSNLGEESVSEMLKGISIGTQDSQHSVATKHISKHFYRITRETNRYY